jgi:hypothetical protein
MIHGYILRLKFNSKCEADNYDLIWILQQL